jgi:hypothetical protein
VVVAGGGPAGLECARRLAERGHSVELWEAGDRLGGRLALAERADPDLVGLLDWLMGGALDAGVVVHLNQPLDLDEAELAGAEVLVWAAGATWAPPGSGLVLDDLRPWLDGDADPLGRRVTVVGGGKAAVTLAAYARSLGREVALVSADPVLAPELGLPGRFRLVHDTQVAGVALHVADGTDPADLPADTVLRIGPGAPRPAPVVPELEIHVIGDASGTVGLGQALGAAARVADAI